MVLPQVGPLSTVNPHQYVNLGQAGLTYCLCHMDEDRLFLSCLLSAAPNIVDSGFPGYGQQAATGGRVACKRQLRPPTSSCNYHYS